MEKLEFFIRKNALTVLLLVCLAAFFAACGDDDDDDNDDHDDGGDLVWSMDFESAQDVEATGGRIVSKNPILAFVPGLDGNAFYLSDGNAVLMRADGKLPVSEGTMEFWILPKAVWHDDRHRQILSVGGESNFAILKDSDKNFLNFVVGGHSLYFKENLDLVTYYFFEFYAPYIWDTKWTHVAVVWKNLGERSEGMRRIYIDGRLKNEETQNLPNFDVDETFHIGALRDDAQPDCLIDNLRIYNRAKSEEEIQNDASYLASDRTLTYQPGLIPVPQAWGKRPEAGFVIDADTKIVVAPEYAEKLGDMLAVLQDWAQNSFGVRPEVTLVPDDGSGAFNNVIAIGTPDDNLIIRSLANRRGLPLSEENLGSEGYAIEVYSNAVAAAAMDYPGVVHALTAVIRLVAQHHPAGELPALTVVDKPDFEIRGTEMLGIETLDDELKRRIRYMAELKLTHLLIPGDFYFDLDDPAIRAEVQAVFEYARDYGIEPVPQLALYGDADRVIAECSKAGFDCADGNSNDTCPMVELMYTDVYDPLLRNIAEYLDPAWIHIGHSDIRSFNRADACLESGLSAAELYAYSVNRTVGMVREILPDTQIMIWSDMIEPLHNGYRLMAPAPGSDEDPPLATTLVPHDITWCTFKYSNYLPLLYVYGLFTFTDLAEDGYTYTAGGGGHNPAQGMIWMRNARDYGGKGFIGRPTTDAGFEDREWAWLPSLAEAAWSYWMPVNPENLHYDYYKLNASYGAM